ncbi:MAG: D-alanyl-D-alanine carboxypeptidase [Spirochaetaceae bacterium]|nr:D-alanyl-D-alanine carboxypeptidase [Spirochaetaceae bacterium]
MKTKSTAKKIIFIATLNFAVAAAGALAQSPLDDVPELNARSAVLMDAATGLILFEKDADTLVSPASLTKLMTMHVAEKKAAEEGIPFDEPVRLPSQSWAVNQPPRSSLMFLAQGHIVSLHELFLGMSIPSGNDAAVAVALNFSPTIEAFAKLMNREAEAMGLKNTFFVEPSGISDENITTARDFAVFCREYLRLYPQNLKKYHSVTQFSYPKTSNLRLSQQNRVNTIVHGNHNNLLYSFAGVDGIKTGYIDEAGYNIALTAERDGTRFIAVVLGVPTTLGSRRGIRARDADGEALLTWGFKHFKTIRPEIALIPPARLWKGKENSIPLDTLGERVFTALTGRGDGIRYEFNIEDLVAPLPAGFSAGTITFYDVTGKLLEMELVTTMDAEAGNFFKRLWDSILLFFKNPLRLT